MCSNLVILFHPSIADIIRNEIACEHSLVVIVHDGQIVVCVGRAIGVGEDIIGRVRIYILAKLLAVLADEPNTHLSEGHL